jgi:hypothetical protein
MKGINTMIKKAKLIVSDAKTDFQEDLDDTLNDIQSQGYDIEDIKFSTDTDYFNAVIIYSETESSE